jgi:hypothetical protein
MLSPRLIQFWIGFLVMVPSFWLLRLRIWDFGAMIIDGISLNNIRGQSQYGP